MSFSWTFIALCQGDEDLALALALRPCSGWAFLRLSLTDLFVLEGELLTIPTLAPSESAFKPLFNDPFVGLKHLLGSGCPTVSDLWGGGRGAQVGEGHA